MTVRDVERALRTALSRGGDWAELFWERHETLQLVLDDKRIEDAITGVDQGAGVRVTSGEQTVYANGNMTDVDDVMAIAGRAARSVADGSGLHEAARLVPDELPRPHSVAIDPRTVPVERKVALLRLANDVARAHDPRVSQATVSYAESVQEILVANSEGVHRTDTRVRVNFAVQVVAKDGVVLESGFEAVRGTLGFELLTEDAVRDAAQSAARRAVLNVGAQPAPAGTYTVVLSSEAGGTLIHESVGHGLEADLNLKGLSVYSGRIGEKVASELITVVDDGRDPGRRGTAAMDDEATPTQRTVLIAKGILKTYLSDRKHAEKLGIPRSGNARRENFRHLPICRMSNT
ncbi:MAG: TldD/PmbA family protein, partial [Chloroflexi bacterium]